MRPEKKTQIDALWPNVQGIQNKLCFQILEPPSHKTRLES